MPRKNRPSSAEAALLVESIRQAAEDRSQAGRRHRSLILQANRLGLPVRIIAEETEQPAGTVYSWLQQARREEAPGGVGDQAS